ncbi:putative eka-like protein [Erysiphe necator]|uniref:Putative eka-like protein n=1 Tax=Uncinula necator TaxID=52586 RepID=A0A0B1PDQ8_UNCNE|nr:putative eka-like protein [Erysiphe necator]
MRNSKNAKKSNAEKTDSRLFVRLPLEHEWRKLSPASIREMVVKRLSISPASIGLIKPARSGFALSPCSIEVCENILKASGGLFLSGAKLEPATQWIPLLIPTVPKSINTLQGHKEISELMLADEIERVSLVRPQAVKLYGYQKPDVPHRTWLVLFTKTLKPGFRVFDESVRARAAEEKASEMEALIGHTENANPVMEANKTTIISVPESPEAEEELTHKFDNVTQESVEVAADSSMQL